MKFLTLAALSVFGLVAAQDLSGLPACAYNCALQGIGGTGCSVTDSACICAAQSFLSDVQSCISAPGACSEADIQATLQFANTFCGGSVNGTSSAPSGSSSETGSATSSSETGSEASSSSASESSASESSASASESSSSESSASESSASESSAAVASETSGSFAGPTLAAVGVAQLLGVAGVVVAAL